MPNRGDTEITTFTLSAQRSETERSKRVDAVIAESTTSRLAHENPQWKIESFNSVICLVDLNEPSRMYIASQISCVQGFRCVDFSNEGTFYAFLREVENQNDRLNSISIAIEKNNKLMKLKLNYDHCKDMAGEQNFLKGTFLEFDSP